MIKINKSISVRKIEKEIFIFDRRSSMVHSLNRVASFIWELLTNEVDPKDIPEKLCNQFEVDKETAQKDVHAFVHTLKETNIVHTIS